MIFRSLFGYLHSFCLRLLLICLLAMVSVLTPGLFTLPAIASSIQPVEIDVLVQGLSVRDPQVLFKEGLKAGTKTNLTLRNQPEGSMDIKSVKQLPITISVPQPDGSVKDLPSPKQDFKVDLLITLVGKAQTKDSGLFFGKSQLRIGTPTELEGFNYLTKASVIDVRLVK